jgi:hypothetical protein
MEDSSNEPLGKKQDALLMLYEQSCENARAYMDLRFKHFTTFMFLTGLLGAIAFQVDALKSFRPLFSIMAIILTVLFWLLDSRTAYHQKTELIRAKCYENIIGAPMISPPPTKLKIKASLITNLIFLAILMSWSYMGYMLRHGVDIQQPAVEKNKQNDAGVQSPGAANDSQKVTGLEEQKTGK